MELQRTSTCLVIPVLTDVPIYSTSKTMLIVRVLLATQLAWYVLVHSTIA